MEKRCPRCKEVKPLGEFSPRRERGEGHVNTYCKACRCEMVRDSYWLNPAPKRDYARRRHHNVLKHDPAHRAYASKKAREAKLRARGLTDELYRKLYDAQDGRCRLCDEWRKTLNIDHNHENNVTRGLLCLSCNTGLGHFRDSIPVLRRAIEYLNSDGYINIC